MLNNLTTPLLYLLLPDPDLTTSKNADPRAKHADTDLNRIRKTSLDSSSKEKWKSDIPFYLHLLGLLYEELYEEYLQSRTVWSRFLMPVPASRDMSSSHSSSSLHRLIRWQMVLATYIPAQGCYETVE